MRQRSTYPLPDPNFWQQALRWAATQPGPVLYLAPSAMEYPHGTFLRGLACGAIEQVQAGAGQAFSQWRKALDASPPDWWFGHLSYDLKNELEALQSDNPNHQGFPELAFFRPQHWLYEQENQLVVETTWEAEGLLEAIRSTQTEEAPTAFPPLQPAMPKEQYIDTVERLRQHIEEGDVYEINFCQAFASMAPGTNPVALFERLQASSPTPFAAYYRWDQQHLCCASPERFLKRKGRTLISQPIKGTAPRGHDATEDAARRQGLLASEKERAENLMIVDLVRNDLARSAVPGTVSVPELFGLYTFPQVHQMISTVTAELRPGVSGLEALARAFPMGSMTGAPKVKVMELIERYETTRRGLFSGAVGYLDPQGNFDFNVVIRSLFYNGETEQLSYQVGGAITYDSDPEQEYAECLIKAEAMQQALRG